MIEQIEEASNGLWYVSETDAEIEAFEAGPVGAVTKNAILEKLARPPQTPVEERAFEDFFKRLTTVHDWFGEEEKATARRFVRLKNLLEANLSDLRVFKVGRIEIEIFVVGLDAEGDLAGIRTEAVET